jgi:hypothetical protein
LKVVKRNPLAALRMLNRWATLPAAVAGAFTGSSAGKWALGDVELEQLVHNCLGQDVYLDGKRANSPEGKAILQTAYPHELALICKFVLEVHAPPLHDWLNGIKFGGLQEAVKSALAKVLASNDSGPPSPKTSEPAGPSGVCSHLDATL